MTRTKKTVSIAAVLVLLSGGTAWSMRPAPPAKAATRPAEAREIVAPGVVEAASDPAPVGFETSGRVIAVLVEEGDRVEEGQLLARLDDRIARARVASAEAALAGARARKDMVLVGARADELRAAEADTEAALAQARDRQVVAVRAEKLLAGSAISQAEADGARDAAAAARATAAAAEARLSLVRSGERGEAKRGALAGAAGAEADLELARAMLAQTELRSPRAGVVLRRMVEVGEQVSTMPPKVVLTIADVERLLVRAEVDETDVARVRVGQSGFVSADAYGAQRFPGRVVRIQRELGRKALRLDDPHARIDTRVLEVTFELDAAPELPLGLRMDTHLETPQDLRQ